MMKMKKLIMLCLVLGLVAVSQATLIDFGAGGAVLTGWTGVSGPSNDLATKSVTEGSTTVSMTANRWKKRDALTDGDFMALSDMLRDFAGPSGNPDNVTDATLSLELAAGTYDITVYHHESKASATRAALFTLTDADGVRTTETLTCSFGTDPTVASLTTYTTTIKSNGLDAVTLSYDNSDGDNDSAFPINGMRLENFIPYKPVAPNPEDGDSVAAENPKTLSWTNAAPNTPGDDVYVDVYFGKDPNELSDGFDMDVPLTTVPADGMNLSSVTVNASAVDTYYWRVDSYRHGKPGTGDGEVDYSLPSEPNVVVGDIWSFTTTIDAAPTVEILTPATMTWSDNSVTLDATITDAGLSALTYGWTAEPNGLDDPDLNVNIVPDVVNPEDITVTVTNTTGSKVTVTLTLTAFDDAHPEVAEASVEIVVYRDACHMAKGGENIPVPLGDVNADCITNLLDLTEMAKTWIDDYKSTGPMPR
jgi:hypothetical protein